MKKRLLLTFGIPGEDFTEFLTVSYPAQGWSLLCAESRPTETILADKMRKFISRGYDITVITDNMMGFCFLKKKIALVFIFYQQIDKDWAYCQGGSLLTAVLAKELKIPCHLYPADYNLKTAENSNSLCFAGDTIVPRGVKSLIPRGEKIPMSYVAKKW